MSSAQPFTVLCYGDSLTEGNAMVEADRPFVWPLRVEKESAGKIRMLNEGKGGRPTSAISELEDVLKRHAGEKIDAVLIALGGNDARDISGNCVPHAVANMRRMIQMARGAFSTAQVFIGGPANIRKDSLGPTKPIGPQREQNLIDLNTAFEKLAVELGCRFFSFYGLIPLECLTMDGVHPDAQGNEPLARRFLEFLE